MKLKYLVAFVAQTSIIAKTYNPFYQQSAQVSTNNFILKPPDLLLLGDHRVTLPPPALLHLPPASLVNLHHHLLTYVIGK